MDTYTIFCRESDGTGTTYITSAQAETVEEAKALGLAECARDWDQPEDTIMVCGVARGDVDIIEWDDCE